MAQAWQRVPYCLDAHADACRHLPLRFLLVKEAHLAHVHVARGLEVRRRNHIPRVGVEGLGDTLAARRGAARLRVPKLAEERVLLTPQGERA
eukprot:CAMPEP_0182837202 /NCGR_PEP_ID=MMETSP0006_2-20121128/22569_1 /TAXON_ID=97485 /ORGANISM="Prymnesium parvum, Strain Texoma1" /LENGTH=91 /DNA_ID=CAMNT_0024965993 /DNA_START=240 /DNA_END=513 /DNA_ORIENTATION=+